MSDTDTPRPPPSNFGDYLTPVLQYLSAGMPITRLPPQPPAPQTPSPQPPTPMAQPASMLSPQTAMQPAKFAMPEAQPKPDQTPQPKRVPQQYKPASREPHERWGDTPLGIKALEYNPEVMYTTHAATPSESYPIIGGAGRKIESMAAPEVAGPAGIASRIAGLITPFADLVSGGAFSTGFGKSYGTMIQGQQAQVKMQRDRLEMQRDYYEMQRERMLDAAEDSRTKHQAMLIAYQRVFSLYKNNLINEQEANRLVEQLNIKHNHAYLNDRLHDAGLKAVENYLMDEHAAMVDMWNGTESLRSSDRRRRKDAGLDPDSSLDEQWLKDGGKTRSGERPLPMHGDAEKEKTADASASPEPGSVDEEMVKKHGFTKAGLGALHELLQTGEIKGITPTLMGKEAKNAQPQLISAKNELEGRMKAIAANRDLPVEQKLEEIRKIDPWIADTVQGLMSYNLNPTGLGKQRQFLTQLTNQVGGGNYSEGNYKLAQEFKDPNKREGLTVDRTATLPVAVETLLRGLKDKKENEPIPKSIVEQFKNDWFTGDPKYNDIYSGIRNLTLDAVSITSGRPAPVTSVNQMLEHMQSTSSNAQIRVQAQNEVRQAYDYIQNVNNRWRELTGQRGNMNVFAPGVTKESMAKLDAILRMNPYTGEMPSDADDTLKGIGKSKPGAAERPRWMKEGQHDWTPLRRDEVVAWRKWLDLNPSDPNAQLVREQLRVVP